VASNAKKIIFLIGKILQHTTTRLLIMKKLKAFLFSGSLASLMIFAACGGDSGGDDDPGPSAGQLQAEALAATSWSADFGTNENAITFDGQSRAEDWSSFSLSFTASEGADGIWGGNFSASGQPSGDGQVIWPGSGTWSFANETTTQLITRNDGVEITLSSVTEDQVVLRFTVTDPNARAEGFFDAEWGFTLSSGN